MPTHADRSSDEQALLDLCTELRRDARAIREILHELGYRRAVAVDNLERALEQASMLRVAVVGDFKRGKSTLINALLDGPELLPTDVLPCTSAVIEIRHGNDLGYEQVAAGRGVAASRSEFLDGAGAAESAAEADDRETPHWRVTTPAMVEDLVLVDTPGLNEDETRMRLTEDQADHCHASVLVLAADQPMSGTEMDILERLPSGSTAIVLNRCDQISDPRQLQRIIEHVRSRSGADTDPSPPVIWPFSAVTTPEGLLTPAQLRAELLTFVSQRSLVSRKERVAAWTTRTAEELQLRAAHKRESLDSDREALQQAHERAAQELDDALRTVEAVTDRLAENADRIAQQAAEDLRADWKSLLREWAHTEDTWQGCHPGWKVHRWRQIAEHLSDDALDHLQDRLEQWFETYLIERVDPQWSKVQESVSEQVGEFLGRLNRLAPRPEDREELGDLRGPSDVLQGAVARMAGRAALAAGLSQGIRLAITKRLAVLLGARLVSIANPALIAASIAWTAVEGARMAQTLRKEVRRAMQKELMKQDTRDRVALDVKELVRDGLADDIADIRSLMEEWLADARDHVDVLRRDATAAEHERARSREYVEALEQQAASLEERVASLAVDPGEGGG